MSSISYRLYHHPFDAPSRRVRLALAEKNVACDFVIEKPWDPSAEFRALNPAGEVPILTCEDGKEREVVADAQAICEFLEETQDAPTLLGKDPLARAEVRRLVGWFDRKFNAEVTEFLVGEKAMKRLRGEGGPDSLHIRAGCANIRGHLDYITWLTERRNWLAGDQITLADLAACAHLSLVDYMGDVPWNGHTLAKEWYARLKSRPSFRGLLGDHVAGFPPPRHYADLDFFWLLPSKPYEAPMTRFFPAFVFVVAITLSAFSAKAQEMPMHKMDDQVVFDLSAEDWVTTKTAHVMVNVEAAVNAANAGTTRGDMMKAVNDLVKTDWRLTAFNRSEDQTGLERWSATFEARVPENQLGGLGEAAKKVSKAGMQLSVGNIDFSPTLEEMEAGRAALRAQIYKQASDQLAALNSAIPGHNYRIAMINFTGEEMPMPPVMPHVVRGGVMAMSAMAPAPAPSTERAEKLTITARVVFAAPPDGKASLPITDVKH